MDNDIVYKWVKASDELPDKCGQENSVVIRDLKYGYAMYGFRNYDKENPALYFILGNKTYLSTKGQGNGNSTWSISNLEWLKEIKLTNI